MKKLSAVLVAFGLAFALPQMARAQYTFDFTLNTITVDGTFTLAAPVTNSPDGAYTFSSFNATVSNSAFGPTATFSLYEPGTSPTNENQPVGIPGYNVDNQFYPLDNAPGGGYFDLQGLALIVAGGNPGNADSFLNIYCTSTTVCNIYSYDGDNQAGAFTFNLPPPPPVVHTPESGALSMLALCAIGLAGAFFFKVRQAGLFINR